eukprot:GHUV01048450.1.p1 GENE.GHUV01048450.1~~GHUV01048450.1.p1  ORF type:complete len:126 (+),score=18.67 GHUV01048450.1:363-740(+)
MSDKAEALSQQVRVGLGVIVKRGDHILLGQRHGSLGEGEWALPGGHLEPGESFEACAMREVAEETGILLDHVTFAAVENVIFPSGQHYVVIFMQGTAPQVCQPSQGIMFLRFVSDVWSQASDPYK